MNDWAIEAVDLVKKFPRRETITEDSSSSASGNGSGKNGKAAGTPRRLWPFGKKQQTKMSYLAAVDGVSLNIQRGEIFGLLGPNGAGKSTTIRMLCTLLEPTSGTARVNGYDLVKQATQVRQNLGTVLAGERSIYWKLTARENLEYFAALYHLPPDVTNKRVKELLERMELANRADDLVEKFSTGMKQRVAISKALIANPPILLLDEPTLGLDPQAARNLRELIAQLKEEGHTILLTTHYMEEADLLSDRIGIIDQGKIIALDTPDRLKERIDQKDVIRLEIAGWHDDLAERIQAVPGVDALVSRRMEGERGATEALFEVSLHASSSRAVLPGVIDRINNNGTRLLNMNIQRPSLEDVFINLTGKALRD
jgi:ABC-2 type transport system ATP-binding protein